MKLNNLIKRLILKNNVFAFGRVGFHVFIFLFFVLSPPPCSLSPLFAAKIHSAAGSTSATFLKIGVGARAVSMGGAFTAVSDDPYAIYWNPAGLVFSKNEKNLSFSHNDYFQGLKQEFIMYTLDGDRIGLLNDGFFSRGVWGFGFNYFYTSDDMERRSGLNESDPLNPISPSEGTFDAYDTAVSVSYAFEHEDEWKLGASLKFVRQAIDDESGESFAADIGALREISLFDENFMAGITIQNIGPGIKFNSKRYDLPLVFKVGLSREINGARDIVALDLEKPIDDYPALIMGMERHLTDKLTLNAGYKYRIYGNELGAVSGFASGFGFALKNFDFAYAFTPFGDLGNSHRFTVSLRFGEIKKKTISPFEKVVMAREKIKEGRDFIYKVSSKPLRISGSGVQYNIVASNLSCDISKIEFRTLMRGAAGASMIVKEGRLTESLLSLLDDDVRVLKAFQLASSVGNVRGNVKFNFKISRENNGKGVFLCFNDGQWSKADLKRTGENEEYYYYEAISPFGTHFLIGRK